MAVRILFVDDEPNILQALRRTLRSLGHEWQMEFAGSATAALDLLAKQSFDVIASDLQMPGMDGAALLGEVQKRWPTMLRLVVSGSCEQSRVIRSVGAAHQYLSKPFDGATLAGTIDRAIHFRKLVEDPKLVAFVSGIKRLPTLPDHYRRISEALRDDSRPLREIGDLITQDVALSVKVLQIVNSAFFGLPRKITSPGEAAIVLGIDVLRALALAAEVFTGLGAEPAAAGAIHQLWRHSLEVAAAARTLGQHLGCARPTADAGFLAGVVHEVGRLVFLANRPAEYQACLEAVAVAPRPAIEVELERLGILPEQVGAYLLGSWGLPEDVVTSVVFHRQPGRRAKPAVDALCLLHLAANLGAAAHAVPRPVLDAAYLNALGLSARIPEFERALQERKA